MKPTLRTSSKTNQASGSDVYPACPACPDGGGDGGGNKEGGARPAQNTYLLILNALVISVLLFAVCFCNTGCKREIESASPPEFDTEEACLGWEKRRKFEEWYNKGVACLNWCNKAARRVTLLMEYTHDSEELDQTLRAQHTFLQQAEGCFREALRIDPNSIASHQALCQVTSKLGKYDEAIEHGLLVLEKAPSRMLIYRYVAVAYQRKGYELAGRERSEYYEKAVQIILGYAPRDRDPLGQAYMYTYMGEICSELAKWLEGKERINQYDRIIRHVGGYVEQHPDNEFAEDMRTLVMAAREFKADFESGYK